MATRPKADILPFRRGTGIEHEPETPLATAAAAGDEPTTPIGSSINLADKPKAWFLIGPNGSGKTLLARWMGQKLAASDRQATMVALDPQNRSLATWFNGVLQPATNDGTQTAKWLMDFLEFVMDRKASAIMDFGGGDTALAKLLHATPNLDEIMNEAGVAPIACHMVGPRVEDLSSLEGMEQAGFRPAATVIMMNEGRVDSTLTREEAFARLIRHSVFQRAAGRGAIPLWLPRLEPEVAAEVEGKRLTFGQARDGQVPDGAKFPPIGGFRRAMVRRWLEAMDRELAPVASWMP